MAVRGMAVVAAEVVAAVAAEEVAVVAAEEVAVLERDRWAAKRLVRQRSQIVLLADAPARRGRDRPRGAVLAGHGRAHVGAVPGGRTDGPVAAAATGTGVGLGGAGLAAGAG